MKERKSLNGHATAFARKHVSARTSSLAPARTNARCRARARVSDCAHARVCTRVHDRLLVVTLIFVFSRSTAVSCRSFAAQEY